MTLYGKAVPRIWTSPLPGRERGEGCVPECDCGLTPETSRGFEVIDWARDKLKVELNPWQRWLLVHALELNAELSGWRFRTVLVLVARQNGKTLVKAVLTLWRMFEGEGRYAVGTAQDLAQAREVMNEVLVPMILDAEPLRDRFNPDAENSEERVGIWHKVWSDEYFRLDSRWNGSRSLPRPRDPRYLIKAMNRKAGRGLSGVSEVNIDELREQTDHKGWAAVSKTVMAQADAQIWAMSNMGDSSSVVLNHLRGVAMAGADETMFAAEWSARDGCELDDPEEWAQANPSLGYTLTEDAIRSALLTDPPNVFRTEVLCQGVDVLNTAIDPAGWAACADPAGAVPEGQMALCVEIALEGSQVVAIAAMPLPDGRVRLEVVGVWESTEQAWTGLSELRSALRPAAIGWFPKGPGATLSAKMRQMRGSVPFQGASMPEACMTFADHVDGRRILHPANPILDDQVRHTGTVGSAVSWIFDRGPGPTHAVWAAAGALHLSLNMPTPKRRGRRVIVADST